jgi:hypothetical protein
MAFDLSRHSPDTNGLPIKAFLDQSSLGLAHAASLLGGNRGAKLVVALSDEVQNNVQITKRALRLARDVLDLLQLKHVHDFDRDEAAFFAAIDPSDPAVAEICLLSEAFEAVVEACEQEKRKTALHAA